MKKIDEIEKYITRFDVRDENNDTPLMKVVKQGDSRMVKLFLDQGMEVTAEVLELAKDNEEVYKVLTKNKTE